MRRFKWRIFEKKGKHKEAKWEKILLQRNIDDIKNEVLRKDADNYKIIAKDILGDGQVFP